MLPVLPTTASRSRPEQGTPISNLNPLSAALILATLFNERAGGVIRDDATSARTGTIDTSGSPVKMYLRGDGLYVPSTTTTTNGAAIPVTTNSIASLARFTMLWQGILEGGAGTGRLLAHRGSTAAWGLFYTASTGLISSSGIGGGTYDATLGVTQGDRVTLLLVVEPSGARIWCRDSTGVRVITKVAAQTAVVWDTNFYCMGDATQTNAFPKGLAEVGAVWRRTLTVPEIFAALYDPYQLWQVSPFENMVFEAGVSPAGGFRNLIGSSLIGENPLLPVW